MLNIVLFGAPGCGKGTQAQRISEKYGLNHISTGEVIRGEIARGSQLGLKMKSFIESGRLAPDSLVIDIIVDYLDAHRDVNGNIFDGFPRTTAQAEAFDSILAERGLKVSAMVYMDVPEQELVRRILLRGRESGRADDASEEVIRNRIEVYNSQTAVVAKHYEAQGKYYRIDGVGSLDEVTSRICQAVDSAK
ncbi:MAG: adenylate kinase [Alistipes sp.]|nr:adenylate kinase [Alistipes sp.]